MASTVILQARMPSVGIYKTEGHSEWTSKGPQKHTVTAQTSGLNLPALGHAERHSCLSEAYGGYQGGLCRPKPGEHLGKLEDPPVKLVWKPLHIGGTPALGKGLWVGNCSRRISIWKSRNSVHGIIRSALDILILGPPLAGDVAR